MAVWIGALGVSLKEDSKPPTGTVASSGGSVGVLAWATTPEYRQQVVELRTGLKLTECDSALVISEGGSGDALSPWQVAVLPNQQDCPEIRFSVDRRLATFSGFKAGDQPKASVTFDNPSSAAPWIIILCGVLVIVCVVAVVDVVRTQRSRR